IGKNDDFSKSITIAKRASKTSSSVLIYGDTGTGKELFAQSIHYESKRKDCPFIAQNCAALPESLLESLLFGTTKGSFTGAIDRPGLFEQADGGTLFLDEINSMSMHLQAKLLRVLQESYVRRLGGDKEIPIDVRIISVTNEYPKDLLAKGTLRKDLYYRINVIPIYIPNLIERADDIPLLVDYFIREYNKKLEKDVWMISDELMEAFMQYHWVGNIRELKNFIESSMTMLDQDEHVITTNHMPAHIDGLLNKKKVNGFRDKSIEFIDLNSFIIEKEKEIIIEFLKINSCNVSRTATDLGISRQNLQYKMKIYNIDKNTAK
ncbi:MAG: sigma 54-interacting transcriptional regulator, partial [Bacillota bacterium]|nr:sigma 54-interacting transcriptional regulator [Bacillota bacterium]